MTAEIRVSGGCYGYRAVSSGCYGYRVIIIRKMITIIVKYSLSMNL